MARKTLKIFLDSNVILSGLLSDKGAPRVILDILCLGPPFLKGATGEYNILEIERNIQKKLPAILDIIGPISGNYSLRLCRCRRLRW